MSAPRSTTVVPPSNPSLFHSAVSGLIAGSVSASVFCPIDVLRTRQAILKQPIGVGVLARNIAKTEGGGAFYSGLSATLMALGPNWAVYFTSYELFKEKSKKWMHEGVVMHITCSIAAAVVTDFITNPLWMIKTRLQTNGISKGRNYKGIVDAASKIIKTEGVATLWSGVSAQLLGTIHVAIQFPIYEKLKKKLKGEKEKLSVTDSLIAASCSKSIASVIAYPHEVLRSRFQHQRKADPNHYPNLREACRRILKEEGISGFYRGLYTNLFRVIPSCCVTFSVYEFVIQRLHKS